jgi:hypothetical protein
MNINEKDFEYSRHGLSQEANDWIMCRCGKVFGNGKRMSKYDKFNKHLKEEKK